MTLPSGEAMALAGIGFVALFGLWKVQVAPRLARREEGAPNV